MSLSTLHGMNEFTLSDFHDRSAGAEFIGYTINSNINVKLLNAWSPFHMFQYQFGWENTQQIHFVTLSQHGFFTNQLQHRHFLVDICGFFFLSIFVCVRWYLIYVRCQKIQRGSNIVCGEYISFSIYIYIYRTEQYFLHSAMTSKRNQESKLLWIMNTREGKYSLRMEMMWTLQRSGNNWRD